ncbi:MAG: helix-turn-helix transcriptional regulator [Clostridia bacterium]|nr:helix-turn-helix transcriptional regulator [Clostridia bacterium]
MTLYPKICKKSRITIKDVCNAAGVGSRTMAKLSKNESVTTDTLAGICEALNCDIGDIATFSREPTAFSVYDAHKKFGKKSTRPIF